MVFGGGVTCRSWAKLSAMFDAARFGFLVLFVRVAPDKRERFTPLSRKLDRMAAFVSSTLGLLMSWALESWDIGLNLARIGHSLLADDAPEVGALHPPTNRRIPACTNRPRTSCCTPARSSRRLDPSRAINPGA